MNVAADEACVGCRFSRRRCALTTGAQLGKAERFFM